MAVRFENVSDTRTSNPMGFNGIVKDAQLVFEAHIPGRILEVGQDVHLTQLPSGTWVDKERGITTIHIPCGCEFWYNDNRPKGVVSPEYQNLNVRRCDYGKINADIHAYLSDGMDIDYINSR